LQPEILTAEILANVSKSALFNILNHQSQLENRLTFSLLSRYFTYQHHPVKLKK